MSYISICNIEGFMQIHSRNIGLHVHIYLNCIEIDDHKNIKG